MIIKAFVKINMSGCKIEEILEIEDNLSEEEIDEVVFDWVGNYFEWGWSKVKNSEDNK